MNRVLKKVSFVRVFVFFLSVIFIFNFNNIECFSLLTDESGDKFIGSKKNSLAVNAKKGAILIDLLTGDVLFEQDADELSVFASLNKICSTLIALENCKDLDETFVVDPKVLKVAGTSMGLKEGYVVTMRDLCYGMMLSSGNDAANAAAVRVSGSIEAFVKLMNDKAEELGLKNTVFKNPSGLDDIYGVDKKESRNLLTEEDILKMPHSTAREIAILTREAMKNPIFKKICATKKVKLCYGNPPCEQFIFNHNKLLNCDDSFCGVKTGFTKNAGRCLVAAACRNGVELLAVVLDDSDDWNDCKNMIEYGFSKFKEFELPIDVSKVRPRVLDETDRSVCVEVKESLPKIFLTDSMKKRLNTKIKASSFVFVPIKKGEKFGELEYYIDDKFICSNDLILK